MLVVTRSDKFIELFSAMIQQEFLGSLSKYANEPTQPEKMWAQIEISYKSSYRHYHNLSHLDAMLSELDPHKSSFENWDVIIFAIAYHDIVYNVLKSNNEERSADVAVHSLSKTSLSKPAISFCKQLILATKRHEAHDQQTDLFPDADLSILGSDELTYEEYSRQIRREYRIYPDLIYNPGRKKVLTHFLEMDRIFKTESFFENYESAARRNLQTELNTLAGKVAD